MLTTRIGNNPARTMVAYLWEEMCGYMSLNCSELVLQWGSKAYLLLRNNGKPFTFQNRPLEDETPNCGPRFGQIGTSISRGRNFGIRSPFDAYDSSLERSIWELKLLERATSDHFMDPCCPWIPQNTSFRSSKRLRKFRTRKTAKNCKLCYN